MIDRKPGWRTNLYAYFDNVKKESFDKDTNNCAHFIANGWLNIRDDDPFEPYRQYVTFESQVKALKKAGFNTPGDFFASFCFEHEHVSQARVGDIAIFPGDNESGFASGWVIGDLVFVMRETGLGVMPLSQATRAFAV